MKRVVSFFGIPYLEHLRIHFSQDGEDIVLKSFYTNFGTYRGFYVDIGAHHPFRYSNTFLFYRKGWRGINVDAMPGSMKPFNRFRKRDINIEAGIGKEKGKMTFYCFDDPALNTFDAAVAKERDRPGKPITKRVEVQVTTLKDILDTHLPPNTQIDFLSVDVEGFDHLVLLSNDWTRYKPKFVLVEFLDDEHFRGIDNLLKEHGYTTTARVRRTVFYVLEGLINSDRVLSFNIPRTDA